MAAILEFAMITMSCQPAGCTPPRPENRPGEAGEPGTPLDERK